MSIWDRGVGRYAPGLDVRDARRLATAEEQNDLSASQFAQHLNSESSDANVEMRNEFGHKIKMNLLYDSDEDEVMETDLDKAQLSPAERQQRQARRGNKFQTLKMEPGHKPIVTTENTCCCTPSGVSLLSRLQSSWQRWMRPATWCSCAYERHAYEEEWEFPEAGPDICYIHCVAAVKALATRNRKVVIYKQDNDEHRLVVHIYSTFEVFRVMDLKFQRFSENVSSRFYKQGCVGLVRSYTTGFVPTSLPLAPLCSVICCWVPFGDDDDNLNTVRELRGDMLSSLKMKPVRNVSTQWWT